VASVPRAPSPFPTQPAPGPSPSAPLPPLLPPAYSEQGVASWYGLPFHGRKASDGEIFDMNQLVAAHRTLPFNSVVRVTNLNNGRQIEVRIIDRGPFVAGRVIDLSLAAARAIDMIGTGIAPVRIELVTAAPPVLAVYSVQIGAFQESQKAEELRAQLAPRYPVFVQEFNSDAGHFYRVRVGRLATQQEAQQLAYRITTDDNFATFVVRLDGLQ
jgi:rare lipoprotein A